MIPLGIAVGVLALLWIAARKLSRVEAHREFLLHPEGY
jgi:hypothetical protein